MHLLNNLGIGAMGMGGTNTVLGVHIEKKSMPYCKFTSECKRSMP